MDEPMAAMPTTYAKPRAGVHAALARIPGVDMSREVRFAITPTPDRPAEDGKPSNSYGGFPSLNGPGRYFAADVTIAGELDPQSQYLMNIKSIDEAVREALPEVESAVRKVSASPAELMR